MVRFTICGSVLGRSPGFAAIAILSLGLGIGANSAIFTLVNAALLRPPVGVRSPETLVTVWQRGVTRSGYGNLSYPDYLDIRDQTAGLLDGLACHAFLMFESKTGDRVERLSGQFVSPNYFSVLGAKMELGRPFRPEEGLTPGKDTLAVISNGLWKRRYGGDPAVTGKSITLNGQTYTIIGVTERGFHGMQPVAVEVFVPATMLTQLLSQENYSPRDRGASIWQTTGRLKAGVPIEQAGAQLSVVARNLAAAYPDYWAETNDHPARTLETVPGTKSYLPPQVWKMFVNFFAVLMAVVGLVLLIACANIANLLLARAAARNKEIAIRLSLGAGRWRVVRQLLTENVLLSLAGGVLALVLASWAADLVLLLKPRVDVPLVVDLALDWRVFGFTGAVAIVTGLLFGLAPALAATKPDVAPVLKGAGSTSQTGHARFGLRNVLTGGQAALSMLLLIASGLFVRSLQNAHSIDPGFEPSHAMVVPASFYLRPYTTQQTMAGHERLLAAVRAVPGVKSAALARIIPLSLNSLNSRLFFEGETENPRERRMVDWNTVGVDYFRTMEIPVVRGRGFVDADRDGAPRVAMVNEAFASLYWAGQNPLGRRFSLSSNPPKWLEVVGVTKTGKYSTLGEDPRPFVYLPYGQNAVSVMQMVVRTEGRPAQAVAAVRKSLQQADADLPLDGILTMEESLATVLLPARLAGSVLGVFGAMALVLAGVGLYGVMAFLVAQRTREIGIRMALGARPGDVLRMVLRRGMTVALVGMLIGLAAAMAVMRFVASFLYGIGPTDPLTFGGVFLLLTLVAAWACLVPARRAAGVDPMVALRYE